MLNYTDNFKKLLIDFDFQTLENTPHSVFGLSKDLEFIYFNPAWFKFSESNDGEPHISNQVKIGSKIEDSISGPLKEFYIANYDEVLKNGTKWVHRYECSSRDIFRSFHQIAYPLKNGQGIIVCNSLVIEKNHIINNEIIQNLVDYQDENKIFNQCSNCRKTQKTNSEIWSWIPDLIDKNIKNISHTICPICFDYYWKK